MENSYEDAGSMDAMVIDVDTTGAIEMGPVQPGEYKLQCIKTEVKEGIDKNGNPWKGISILFDLPEELEAGLINHMVFLPRGTGTEKQNAQAISRFDLFKRAFGFDPAEKFTPQDLVGREVWGTVTLIEDPEYGFQNRLQRFVVSQG